MNLYKYSYFIFDCDGVILNSNFIKEQTFKKILENYKKKDIDNFIDFHLNNLGISRYKKFDYFFSKILKLENYNEIYKKTIKDFSDQMKIYLKKCEITENLYDLRKKYKNKWIVISGSDHDELNYIFKLRNIDNYFDGGIYGSPNTKYEIFKKLEKKNLINNNSIYFGDSKSDYLFSQNVSIDFAFIYEWTTQNEWKLFCEKNNLNYFANIYDCLK